MYSKSLHLKENEPSLQAILMIPDFCPPHLFISGLLSLLLLSLSFDIWWSLWFPPSVISYLWKIPFFLFSPFFYCEFSTPSSSPICGYLPLSDTAIPLAIHFSVYFQCTFCPLCFSFPWSSFQFHAPFSCFVFCLFFLGFGLVRDITFYYIQLWPIFQITGSFPLSLCHWISFSPRQFSQETSLTPPSPFVLWGRWELTQ